MEQEVFENISTDEFRAILDSYRAKKIFLVTGKSSYIKTGAKVFLEKALSDLHYIQFSDFGINPKIEDIKKGVNLFSKNKCDLIVAVGGGSTIDVAKCINIFQAHPELDNTCLVHENKIVRKGVTLIAIPTTAGSGSEATHFAVIYINKLKYSLSHSFILPDIICFNYHFTFSQPPYLTACAGLDAFSQAIESFWSVNSTIESKEFAENAIKLLFTNLSSCVINPSEKNRIAVAKGAYLAGKAINISKTTAPHAISYALTTHFSIPHGHAVFLTVPAFLRYNYNVSENDITDLRGVEYVRNTINSLCKILGFSTVEDAYDGLINFASDLGIELSFNKLDIKNREDLIIANVNNQRLNNNPRKVTEEFLRRLFQ